MDIWRPEMLGVVGIVRNGVLGKHCSIPAIGDSDAPIPEDGAFLREGEGSAQLWAQSDG